MAVSVAAIAGALAVAYPIIDSIVRETNAKKVSQMRKNLESVLSKYNLKISQLRTQLEKRGIEYDRLVDKLYYASPSGSAARLLREEEKAYNQDVKTINSKIDEAQHQIDQYSALENKNISDVESRGLVRTIFNN